MSTPTISLCVIAANEAPFVERFLDSFKDAFDELCIVRAIGNQSHDKTLALAKAWCEKNGKGVKASEYHNAKRDGDLSVALAEDKPWTWPHVDDFAAARNLAWGMATCSWQFWADLDDLLQPAAAGQPGGAELIRLCAAADSHDYFFFTYDIRLQSEENVRERLFRTGISQWVQPLHEVVRVREPEKGKQWKALIEPRVIFEHAPKTNKIRDPMRNRRIMAYHLRYLSAFAFEIHREFYYDWQFSRAAKAAEQATKWAEIAHQTDCLPEQRYDMLLNQAHIVAEKDLPHAFDLVWSAIRIHPKCRTAWGDLANYELRAGVGSRAAVATAFMQSISKPPKCGYPQSNRYHEWEGSHLRARSLRAAGVPEMARKFEDDIFAKNGKRISLLHATRGRPELALLTRHTFFRAAFMALGIEHIFAIDADDAVSLAALKDYRHVVVEKPNGCVKAWNAAAEESTGHVLVQLSDDWNPCHDWDILIWEALAEAAKKKAPIHAQCPSLTESELVERTPLVLAIHDGHRKDALLCMAICTRARYEYQRLDAFCGSNPIKGSKYLFHPDYFGVFSDNEFSCRAYDDGIVVQAQHIVLEHRHPIFVGKPYDQWDDTHRRQNAPERYAEGKAIFNRRNPKHAIS